MRSPHVPSTGRQASRANGRSRNLERQFIGQAWLYVTPVAPAEPDEDYVDGSDLYPVFEGDWGNIEDFDATAFRFVESKREQLQLRLAVTGGEDDIGSTIFTLPADYWPARINRIWATVGTDSAGIIDVNTDGTVVYVGRIVVV